MRLLEKQGHAVAVAGNGREALAALERQAFDLVLMDVQMPELDGLETTALIRRNELKSVLVGSARRVLVSDLEEFVKRLREGNGSDDIALSR